MLFSRRGCLAAAQAVSEIYVYILNWVTCLSKNASLHPSDSSANFGISSNCLIVRMQLLDIIGFGLSAIGTFGLAFSFRLLLPRNVIPHVSAALDEVVILLDRAEDINALPNASEYRATLAMYEDARSHLCPSESLTQHRLRNQVVRFRTESHRSPGILQQLKLVFLSGLPYKLYAISVQIEAIRLKVEVRLITFFNPPFN